MTASGTLPPFARRVLGIGSVRRFDYGPPVPVRPLSRRLLLLDPADVRHVLLGGEAGYRKTPRIASAAGRRRVGSGLISRSGEAHRERRRLLQPLLLRRAVERFRGRIAERVEAWTAERRDGERLDLAAAMAGLTRSALLSVLFGDDLTPAAEARLAEAIQARRVYTERLYHGRLPGRDRLPTPVVRAHRRAVRTLDAAVAEAIARRRAAGGGEDLVALLLAARSAEGEALTERDVRDEVLTFTSTGYETLGEALTWAAYLLARHPAVESRLHAALDAGSADRPDDSPWADYAGRILDETLRLYPPTWIFTRVPVAPDRLPSGAAVRPGDTLYVCPWILHRHPGHFPDPERFDPDRFATDRPERFAYLPFGDGPHRCIGEHLARMEAVLALGKIGRRLRLRSLDPRPAEPVGGVTLRPRGGLPVRVELR
ncbi:MAG TPA: cytochrome P450 [Gemmatimonadota bacterium]|nr:cytochrome P450 [Gemmatimonadota bacterium]